MTSQLALRHSQPPLLMGASIEEKREEIRAYFHKTWDLYQKLFDLIESDHSYFSRPEPLRHPLIFYYGHTATFYINKMIYGKYIDRRIDSKLESMLAIGVDEMSWDDLDNSHYDWPTVEQVRNYRDQAKKVVDEFITSMPISLPIHQDDPAWLILMGIEHERIHIETSSVIIRMLPENELCSSPFWGPFPTSGIPPINELVAVPQQEVSLGKHDDDFTFGWDNEFGEAVSSVSAFQAAKYLTSNQEFLEFVLDGGYRNKEFWCSEGATWLTDTKAEIPRFWFVKDKKYYQRNLHSSIELPLDWPVEVNYYESAAFCRWKCQQTGKKIRLPFEEEWAVLRTTLEDDLPGWNSAPGNTNLEHYASSCPVDLFKQGDFYDIIGNVWQWTESPIGGFKGFQVHRLYDDFSVPTFDGRHYLFKGGCWASTGNVAQRSARYAFRKHFFQHAGFRYIESATAITDPDKKMNIYESNNLISQYLEFHYGDRYFDTDNFPVTCARKCIEISKKLTTDRSTSRALDLGCAVGRSSLELAHYYDHVTGIDFSARFIQQAVELCEQNKLSYKIPSEGNLTESKSVNLAALGYHDVKKKVDFQQGDACNLKGMHTNYDLIFAGNLVDRLYDPALFISNIHERLAANGLFVLTSPYTWLEEYTEQKNWLGGKTNLATGAEILSFDAIKQILEKNFELVARYDIPFIIRETQRKFQHSVAEMSAWRLK